MRTLPYCLQPVVYSKGSYNHFYSGSGDGNLNGNFIRHRLVLSSLGEYTRISDNSQNCFFILDNETTHEVCLLSDERYEGPVVVQDKVMYLDDEEDYKHYQCNVEACRLLGQWLDYLRENNIYDNTRIIIVADHGYGLNNFDELLVMDLDFDAEWANPVLLVKDFNKDGFTVNNDLMTNADTPFLALDGVIADPVNPFTGNPITPKDKSGDQLVYVSHKWNTITNHGTQFKDPDGYWVLVHDNIWDDDNWSRLEGEPDT